MVKKQPIHILMKKSEIELRKQRFAEAAVRVQAIHIIH